jgi:hypothetical protein
VLALLGVLLITFAAASCFLCPAFFKDENPSKAPSLEVKSPQLPAKPQFQTKYDNSVLKIAESKEDVPNQSQGSSDVTTSQSSIPDSERPNNISSNISSEISEENEGDLREPSTQAFERPTGKKGSSQREDLDCGLCLDIASNRTEGHEGDAVSFRCVAKNCGEGVLYDIVLSCKDEKAASKFLEPGKEISIDGSLLIRDHVILNASVQSKDSSGRLKANNTTLEIWKLSPQLKISSKCSQGEIHKGDEATLTVTAENSGNCNLSNLKISDSLGEIGSIQSLGPGEARSVSRNSSLERSLSDEIRAVAQDSSGRTIYASGQINLTVLEPRINLTVEPSEALVYPGDTVQAAWIISNTGDEALKNVSLIEEGAVKGKLQEIPPGESVRVAAMYAPEESELHNMTAVGSDQNGYAVQDASCLEIRAVVPGIKLKVAPEEITACPDSEANITCLVTNSGDDTLTGISLYGNGSLLEKIDRLDPGEFKVIYPSVILGLNGTVEFRAEGRDTRDKLWSDRASVNATIVASSVKVQSSADPNPVACGDRSRITCTVENTGSTTLYNIFLISKTFGPIGTVDHLLPGRQKSVSSDKVVTKSTKDTIIAEGFTADKASIRDSCEIAISVLRSGNPDQEKEEACESALDPDQAQAKNASRNSSHAKLPDMPEATLVTQSFDENSIIRSSEVRPYTKEAPYEDAFYAKNGPSSISAPEQESTEAQESELKENISQLNSDSQSGASGLLRYLEKMLEKIGLKSEEYSEEQKKNDIALEIESIKGSERTKVEILDVTAVPTEPTAKDPVKVSVHATSDKGIESVSLHWGIAVTALAKEDTLSAERTFSTPMTLDAGDDKDGYWSCEIPGRSEDTCMAISVTATDGSAEAEKGPYQIRWKGSGTSVAGTSDTSKSGVSSISKPTMPRKPSNVMRSDEGMLFIESTTVSGVGEISIKDKFHESTMGYDEKMKGYGAMNIESLRTIGKGPVSNFSESRDLNFEGQLKAVKTLSSPKFQGGLGASVTESYNTVKIDKSEVNMIRSTNPANNTLAFKTDQSFDGMWNFKTQYAQFYKRMKADQKYTGQFETQKDVTYQD